MYYLIKNNDYWWSADSGWCAKSDEATRFESPEYAMELVSMLNAKSKFVKSVVVRTWQNAE